MGIKYTTFSPKVQSQCGCREAGQFTCHQFAVASYRWFLPDNDIQWKLNTIACSKIHQTFAMGLQSKKLKYKPNASQVNHLRRFFHSVINQTMKLRETRDLMIIRAITDAVSSVQRLVQFDGIISWPGDLRTLISFSNSSTWVSLARWQLKQAGALASAPIFTDCFETGMISIILTVILYSYFRHAISK